MSFAGSSPTLAAMILSNVMIAVPRVGHAYGLPLQIEDAANGFAREQFETGRMHPGQHHSGERRRSVDLEDRGGGEVLVEVRVSARDPIGPDDRIYAGHVADVGEPLVTQEWWSSRI